MNPEKEINDIKLRNKKVELDKSWEISLTRKIIITFLTYIVILSLFLISGLSKPYFNALIPTLAFILSNLSLNLFKKIWIKYGTHK